MPNRLLAAAALLVATSAVATACGSSSRTQAPVSSTVLAAPVKSQEELLQPPETVPVPADVDAFAEQWMRDAMGRTHLQRAWDGLSANWQSRLQEDRWLKGAMPVVPLPAEAMQEIKTETSFRHHPGQLIIKYDIVGTNDSAPFNMAWFITLVQEQGQWKVDYFSPYAPPAPTRVH